MDAIDRAQARDAEIRDDAIAGVRAGAAALRVPSGASHCESWTALTSRACRESQRAAGLLSPQAGARPFLPRDIVYQGATWDLVLRLYNPSEPDGDGLPRSAVGLVVNVQIRADQRDDATLLASASTTDGRVTTDADGYVRIRLPNTVTAAMPFLGRPRTWYYDVRISEAGDTEPVRYWIYGPINAQPRVTS